MGATQQIAQYIDGGRLQDVPPKALDAARTAILDTIGTMLAGSREDSGRIAAELAREEGGRDEATVYGQRFRAPATQAAFVNGVAAHASDFDHSFVVGGQPMAPIIPALTALAEAQNASGRHLLEAYVTGFEVNAALSFAASRLRGEGGWHANSVQGVFGAVAACGKLLRLDQEHAAMALGIAASMASGLTANFGTMSKPLHVGLAARAGVQAARLAQAGFTANAEALEARNGYFQAFYGGQPPADAFDGLGRDSALEKYGVRIKPYPCGGLTHTAIYATLQLRERLGLTADQIEHVDVDVPRGTYETIAFRVPETALQGKFCMPYLVARAIIDGTLTLGTFTEEAVRDSQVLALAGRVTMRVGDNMEAGQGARPAMVTVRLRDGQTHSLTEGFPKGSPQVPMTEAELEAKFRDCARGVIAEPERVAQLVHELEHLSAIPDLAGLLAGG